MIAGSPCRDAGKKPGRRQKKSGRDYIDDDDDVDFKRAANGSIIKRVVPRSSCASHPSDRLCAATAKRQGS